MMTAFREQVTNVFRINLVQQIIENYKTRFTVLVAEILRTALVKLTFLCKEANFSRRKADFSL